MTTQESVHYVLILEVQKITKTSINPSQRYEKVQVDVKRDVSEVAKVIIKDKSLGDLIIRGTKHLDLVTDEAE